LDPLAQLSDIHLPTPVHQYPIALGWWLLAALIISALIWSILKFRHYKKSHKTKIIALKQLQQNPEMCAEDVLLLLKWAALAYFPRKDCAHLYGKSFQQFLMRTLPEKIKEKQRLDFKEQLQKCTNSFENIYHKNSEHFVDSNVNKLANTWIRLALPVKNKSINVVSANKELAKAKINLKTNKNALSTSSKGSIS